MAVDLFASREAPARLLVADLQVQMGTVPVHPDFY